MAAAGWARSQIGSDRQHKADCEEWETIFDIVRGLGSATTCAHSAARLHSTASAASDWLGRRRASTPSTAKARAPARPAVQGRGRGRWGTRPRAPARRSVRLGQAFMLNVHNTTWWKSTLFVELRRVGRVPSDHVKPHHIPNNRAERDDLTRGLSRLTTSALPAGGMAPPPEGRQHQATRTVHALEILKLISYRYGLGYPLNKPSRLRVDIGRTFRLLRAQLQSAELPDPGDGGDLAGEAAGSSPTARPGFTRVSACSTGCTSPGPEHHPPTTQLLPAPPMSSSTSEGERERKRAPIKAPCVSASENPAAGSSVTSVLKALSACGRPLPFNTASGPGYSTLHGE